MIDIKDIDEHIVKIYINIYRNNNIQKKYVNYVNNNFNHLNYLNINLIVQEDQYNVNIVKINMHIYNLQGINKCVELELNHVHYVKD